jgi:hypothetical protein
MKTSSAAPVRAGPVRVMVRPEALVLAPAGSGAPDRLPARVLDRRFAGAVTYYRVEVEGAGPLVAAVTGTDGGVPEAVEVGLAPDATAHAFPES